MIKIGLDAMGGDFAPQKAVLGAMLAIKKIADIEIVLYGDQTQIQEYLTDNTRISIIHTDKFVDMGEKDPVKQIRRNPDSSMALSLKAAKEKQVDAVVSAGPTQALIVGAHVIVKRMAEVERVALAPIIPSSDGKGRILLDVGANIELRPDHLEDLAVFATIVAREYLKIENPLVGLINIGTEAGKGRELDKLTYELLEKNENIHFYGNVEPKEILTTTCNVLITDGFTGNILLKTLEGTAKATGAMLKEEIKRSLFGKIGYLFMRKNLKRYARRLNASEVGGAMIFGINSPVIKAHGSSDEYAFYNAIRQAKIFVENDVINKVTKALQEKTGE